MSSISEWIRRAFGGKRPEVVETVRFSEVISYMERLTDSGEASRDYSMLIKSYDEFMENLDGVRNELDVLRDNGERRFTRTANEILKGMGGMDEFELSSFKEFYVDAAQAVQGLTKIPGTIQRKTLSYENGRETIDALNSLLKSFRKLKKVRSRVLAEDSVLKHHRSALTKYRNLEEAFNRKGDLQKGIELLEKEKEEKKRSLEETTAKLQAAQSEIDNEEILEVKKRITSLDSRIREITSDLRINLRRGRRPISKILHSKDRRLFEFFKHFSKYPLENINKRFWEMIATLEKEEVNLGEKERKKIDDFVSFSRNKLVHMLRECGEAEAKKRELREIFNKISSRNKELLGNLELEKDAVQNDFKSTSNRLDEMRSEKNTLETDIEKNARALQKMLSKTSGSKVRIEFE